jgi:P-type conjugative transfer protein TrbL
MIPIARDFGMSLWFFFFVIGIFFVGWNHLSSDLGLAFGNLLRLVLTAGFFLWVLTESTTVVPAIVNSFIQLANRGAIAAGATPAASPSDVFEIGFDLGMQILDAMSIFSPATSLFLALAAVAIFIGFVLVAFKMMFEFIKLAVTSALGIIMLGFGTWQSTRNFSLSYFNMALNIGINLMVLIVIVALGEALLRDWIANFEATIPTTLAMGGATFLFAGLAYGVPSFVSGILSGASIVGVGELLQGKHAISNTLRTADNTIERSAAGTLAVKEAYGLAGAQGRTGAARLMGTVGNLAGAAKDSVGERLAGGHPTPGGVFSEPIRQLRRKNEGLRPQNSISSGQSAPAMDMQRLTASTDKAA